MSSYDIFQKRKRNNIYYMPTKHLALNSIPSILISLNVLRQELLLPFYG